MPKQSKRKSKRKAISKSIRETVYEKYGKKCAYCGCDLEYKDMQVDHAKSVLQAEFGRVDEEELNSLENLMPSCRMCNFYKDASGIEGFRKKLLKTLSHTAVDTFQARMAIKYGMITVHEWDGKFWFEKYNKEDEDD